MPPQVTQCPKCHTSFRVTEAQLQIANGAVRCGSCLHIFNATEHWLDGSSQRPEPTPEPATAPEATSDAIREDKTDLADVPEDLLEEDQAPPLEPASQEELSEELRAIDTEGDDIDSLPSMPDALKSLDEQPEPALNATIEQRALSDIFDTDNQEAEPASLFDDEENDFDEADSLEDLINQHASSAENETPSTDDSDDDLLISDDMDAEEDDDEPRFGDTTQQPAIEAPDYSVSEDEDFEFSDSEEDDAEDEDTPAENTGDFSDSFLDMDNWDDDSEMVFKDLDELGEEGRRDEEEWAAKLLEEEEEDDNDAAEEQPASPEAEPFQDIFSELEEEPENQLDPDLLDILNERDQASESEAVAQEEFVLGDEPMIAGERIGNEKFAMLANIEPEPVVFIGGTDRAKWLRRAWSTAALLAVIALGIQYVYFNFERLARDESTRGSLASLCGIIGCELPDRDDLHSIRSTNLIVRSHPKVADALVVDAILTNRAPFKQRFPDLELLFSNMAGDIVAGRRFTPGEYLQGELSGMTTMPSQQPVHISLEIVDPGKDAVNYQLHFLPTKNS